MTSANGFRLSSVAHLEAPTGRAATGLDSLQDGIQAAGIDEIFHHVVRVSIRHPGAHDLPANDFARWVRTTLQDPETAEQLAYAGSQPLAPLEEVRGLLLGALARTSARRRQSQVPEEAAFHFVRSRSIPAPLGIEVATPSDLVEQWNDVDLAALFYHLIEAPILGPGPDQLVPWLRERGAESLASAAEKLAASGRPLARLHRDLGSRWRRSLIPARLVRRLEGSEDQRREEARVEMARLAERLHGTKGEEPDA